VAQKKIDGAAVDSLIWEKLNPHGSEFAAKTKVIQKTSTKVMPSFVALHKPAFQR